MLQNRPSEISFVAPVASTPRPSCCAALTLSERKLTRPSDRLPGFDDDLQRFEALEVIDLGAIHGANPGRQNLGLVKDDCIQARAGSGDRKPQMLAADHRLLQNREFTVEERCRETLPPDLRADVSGESQRELRLGELAIGFKRAEQRLGRKPIARNALELRRKTRQCRLRKRQSRREGVASEAVDGPRRALGAAIVVSRTSRASLCIVASTSRRSRLRRSSSAANGTASRSSAASRQAMPTDISARRPAAFSRGPTTKPRSYVLAREGSRPAAANRA